MVNSTTLLVTDSLNLDIFEFTGLIDFSAQFFDEHGDFMGGISQKVTIGHLKDMNAILSNFIRLHEEKNNLGRI